MDNLEEVIKEIERWRNIEGKISETAWLKKGVFLYKLLVHIDESNIDHKKQLATLLTRQGVDEKLNEMNAFEAKRIFQEVISIFPNDTEAHYRLGHLAFDQKKWQEAVNHFEQARKTLKSQVKIIRTLCHLAIAYGMMGEVENANQLLKEAKILDDERDFTDEIGKAEKQLTSSGEESILLSDVDGSYVINREEAEDIMEETIDGNKVVLDFRFARPTFSGPEDTAYLEPREACILKCLIKKRKPMSLFDIARSVYEDPEVVSESTMKSYISHLRKKLKTCFLEGEQVIVTRRNIGYQWQCHLKTNIIEQL